LLINLREADSALTVKDAAAYIGLVTVWKGQASAGRMAKVMNSTHDVMRMLPEAQRQIAWEDFGRIVNAKTGKPGTGFYAAATPAQIAAWEAKQAAKTKAKRQARVKAMMDELPMPLPEAADTRQAAKDARLATSLDILDKKWPPSCQRYASRKLRRPPATCRRYGQRRT
jgi:hypothetical protein